jgi:3-hydroxyisobutyrate dehydrogenase-like beta-hydroxyacid dehydrogenase
VLPHADVVVSVVPPSSALSVAREAAPYLPAGTTYLDMTSIDPATAIELQTILADRDVRVAKAAILGPIPVTGTSTPLVVGGDGAAAAERMLGALGFQDVTTHPGVTTPAVTKVLWSIVSKGLTALYAESLVSARRFGAEGALLALLRSQLGFMGSDAMVTRLLLSNVHAGERRAHEVAAAGATVERAGLAPHTAEVTRLWLHRLASLSPRWDEVPPPDTPNAMDCVSWLSDALLTLDSPEEASGAPTLKGGGAESDA